MASQRWHTPLELSANREAGASSRRESAVQRDPWTNAPPSNRTRIERELGVRREFAARNRSSEGVRGLRCPPSNRTRIVGAHHATRGRRRPAISGRRSGSDPAGLPRRCPTGSHPRHYVQYHDRPVAAGIGVHEAGRRRRLKLYLQVFSSVSLRRARSLQIFVRMAT